MFGLISRGYLTTTLSTLELAALGADVGLNVGVGRSRDTKVLNSFTGISLTTDEDCVGTSGGTGSQLVKSQALSTSLDDAGTGSLGETQGGNLQASRNLSHALIIGNGTDHDGDGISLLSVHVLDNSGQGHGGTVDTGHAEALQDDLVEAGVGTARQETVQLDQEGKVDVLAAGSVTL